MVRSGVTYGLTLDSLINAQKCVAPYCHSKFSMELQVDFVNIWFYKIIRSNQLQGLKSIIQFNVDKSLLDMFQRFKNVFKY